jgi:hypothetical protein
MISKNIIKNDEGLIGNQQNKYRIEITDGKVRTLVDGKEFMDTEKLDTEMETTAYTDAITKLQSLDIPLF